MNDRIKYEYILEPAELREFCRKALLEQIKKRQVFWVLLAILLFLEACYLPSGGFVIVMMLVLLFGIVSIYNNAAIRKQLAGQHWTLWVENGKLKSRREIYSEMPCEGIQFIRITRRLLMLGYLQSSKKQAWYVIPLRVFRDVQERDGFINQIRNPWQTFTAAEPMETEEKTAPVYLRLAYMLDAERWVRLSRRALSIAQAGTFGKRNRILGMVFCGCVIGVVLPVSLSILVGGFSWILMGFCIFYAAMMILRIYYRDPEKQLRKQVQSPGTAANRECGLWQVSFSEEGITVDLPGRIKHVYVWDFLAYLVETEEVFYLFSRDKRRFIMVAKESFQTWDQVHLFRRLCEERGIRMVPEKRMHYIPAWVLVVAVLLYLIVCGYLVAFQFLRGYWSGEGLTDTVYEFDYPDYVPLDQQVLALKALGLSVDQDQVETLRDNMETYGMQEFVEGNPYTSLLIDMGAPDYDDDLRIVGYSDEVFWFDFEGFDLSTDYIDILNGMLALSQGSCLDGVTDIEEDTGKVDWERGTGTVTVSMTFNGAQYQWDMEAYYDWIDGDVLGVFNALLEQEESQKFFYATGDNGQGAIVFFCTEEWARAFEMATGLEMEASLTEWEKR